MKPAPFTYHRPATKAEALDVLNEVGDEGKVLAGGQSLLPLLSMRLASPAHLVDINAVPDLATISVDDSGVRIGALVRHTALLEHDEAARRLPLLRQALQNVAHGTIRNRGTTVGSIAHADPSGEMPAVLTLLGGRVVAESTRGRRDIEAADFFLGPLESALEPDEIAVETFFPYLPERTGSATLEVARRHGDYAVIGVVAAVTLDDAGGVASARATYVTAGDFGSVVDLTEAASGVDHTAGESAWQPAAHQAKETVEVDGDIHASAEYRSQLVEVLTRRALHQAAANVGSMKTKEAA